MRPGTRPGPQQSYSFPSSSGMVEISTRHNGCPTIKPFGSAQSHKLSANTFDQIMFVKETGTAARLLKTMDNVVRNVTSGVPVGTFVCDA